MKRDKQKHNWLLDATLFGGFLAALWLDLTGVAVHQWLGVAVGLIAGYHLWKHWSWVKAVASPSLWPHEQAVAHVLRGGRRAGGRPGGNLGHGPGNLHLARPSAGELSRPGEMST